MTTEDQDLAVTSRRSRQLFARAEAVIPGGVNSPVRAFGAVGGTPRFLAAGSGAWVTDVDGHRYLDYVCSWGPLILGHAHPAVVAAATHAVQRGSSFGAPTAGEVELAEMLVDAVPALEQVRLVSSGTEAAMSAVRLARAATGRTRILKFAGHYHGHADALLAQAGSGAATFAAGPAALPASPGVTPAAAADTIVAEWNDREAVEAVAGASGDDLAAIICEPIAANMGLVPPDEGFLRLLRDVATSTGALLVCDEVITGFRVARAGAAALYDVSPDLVVLGKVVGGGFPLAAFGGRRDVMAQLAPAGPVYQAGTLSGNPVAVAAGLAQLRLLDTIAYETLAARAEQLASGLREAFAAHGVVAQVPHVTGLVSVFFSDAPVHDYAAAKRADHSRYARFFNAMLARGHYLPPSGFEALFVSLAHAPEDIDATVHAAKEVAAELRDDEQR